MSTSHLPRDKKDRSVRARKHDPYKTKGKPRESSVCRECKAVYHKGRWTWGDRLLTLTSLSKLVSTTDSETEHAPISRMDNARS